MSLLKLKELFEKRPDKGENFILFRHFKGYTKGGEPRYLVFLLDSVRGVVDNTLLVAALKLKYNSQNELISYTTLGEFSYYVPNLKIIDF